MNKEERNATFAKMLDDFPKKFKRVNFRERLMLRIAFDFGVDAGIESQNVAELDREIVKLQKEIRCECTRCVYSDSPCIRSDYGVKNDEDVCPNYENVFVAYTQLKEENAELKADNDARKFAMAMSEKVEKQLREENAKLKDEWQEQVQKATDEGYARTLQTMQLSKAKELLKKAQGYTENLDDEADKLYDEIEQFLSKVEKE